MQIKAGINPVTIRSEISPAGPALAVLRMGVCGQNLITAALVSEAQQQPLGAATLTEEQFIAALGHLFPRGELVTAHCQETLSAEQKAAAVAAVAAAVDRLPEESAKCPES